MAGNIINGLQESQGAGVAVQSRFTCASRSNAPGRLTQLPGRPCCIDAAQLQTAAASSSLHRRPSNLHIYSTAVCIRPCSPPASARQSACGRTRRWPRRWTAAGVVAMRGNSMRPGSGHASTAANSSKQGSCVGAQCKLSRYIQPLLDHGSMGPTHTLFTCCAPCSAITSSTAMSAGSISRLLHSPLRTCVRAAAAAE